jgi:hypothetical protein
MTEDQYQGDGYEISVRTEFGRVLVHFTRSACEALSAGHGSDLGVIAANSNVIAEMVQHLVTDPVQMKVRIDGAEVTRFLALRH